MLAMLQCNWKKKTWMNWKGGEADAQLNTAYEN